MNDSPKIGLVAPLPPQVGGIASVAEWLLGHEQEIGCEYVAFDLERPPGAEMGGRLSLRAALRQVRLLLRFLAWQARAPKVVHYCVSCTKTGLLRDLLFLALLRASGRRSIAHVHGSGLDTAVASSVFSRVLRAIGRLTSERVSLSDRREDELRRVGVTSVSILNPIRFEPDGPRPTSDSELLRLLFVGTYGRRKGCFVLLEALAEVRSRGVDARLRFVGKEEFEGEEEALRRVVAETGLDQVVSFPGLRGPGQLAADYADADALCLLSFHEGLPMAILEAMAFGLPIVATPVGGIPDIVSDRENGLLVVPGDVEATAAALGRLAAEPDRRAAMGDAARERVRALAGAEVIAAAWRRLYARHTVE